MLHPLFVPAHVAATIGLGLLIGQQGWGRAATLASYVLGLLAGLGALMLAYAPLYAGETVLALAAIAGALVAWARPLHWCFGIVLAVSTGCAVALDSPPEVFSIEEANRMLIGTGLGATVFLLVVTVAVLQITRPWLRIGMRVIGSWIAASAILALALEFVC